MRNEGKRRLGIAIGVLAVVLVVLVLRVGPWRGASEPVLDESHPAARAFEAFAVAWSTATLDESMFAPGDEDAAGVIALVTVGLGTPEPGPEVEVVGVEAVVDQKDRVRGRFDVKWDLGEDRIWSYQTTTTAVNIDDAWLIESAPSAIEPSLRSGEALRARRTSGARGQIRSADGSLVSQGESTVVVTIHKGRTEDFVETARRVAELTSMPPEPLIDELHAASSDASVEAIRLPRSDYDPIRDELQPLPGVFFQEEFEESDVPANFAPAIVGEVGPATDEIIEASGGLVHEGDRVGLSGLQRTHEPVLAGQPGLVVEAVSDRGSRVLESFPGTDGRDITITLDPGIQELAEDVTANRAHPTSLVAVRVSTGEILAIANGRSSYNRALLGRYAPGSSFKIVSAYAMLAETNITPDSIVPCPATFTVGRSFRNADDAALGDVPFRTDFARSCNTAFVSLSQDLSPQQLADAGALLGYRPHDLGLPAISASIPVDGGETEHAAQMIGQGRVEGTVLDVAMLSASIGSGRALQPTLVLDGPLEDGDPLDPTAVEGVRSMMRSAVTDGTATVLLGVPGEEIMAKTGTAEFGTESPPETHAWMTGYRGDIAFAVVVEGGGSGAGVAGPIAAEFLTRLLDI